MTNLIIIDKQFKKKFKISNSSKINQKIIFWNGYEIFDNKNFLSILNLIENQSDVFRDIYLKWINDLGNLNINQNLPVYEKLTLRNKYSFWWQTYFVEKSNYEHSPQINDAIKLIALQHWIKKQNISQIHIFSRNKKLVKCLKNFSKIKGFAFVHNGKIQKFSEIKNYNFFRLIPYELKALIWLLRKIIFAWPKKNLYEKYLKNNKSDLVFVDYFCNFKEEFVSKGIFKSNYWGELNDILKENSIKTNWIHLSVNLGRNEDFFLHEKDIKEKFKLFNNNSAGLENHILLDSFISIQTIKRTLIDWIDLRKKCQNLEEKFKNFRIENLDLFDLYKQEWQESFRGVSSLSTILDFNLFYQSFKNQKGNPKLIYLFENQPWEFAMLQAWKKTNNNKTIGYAHSSISYWDLRKFFDDDTLLNKEFPSPDLYAFNGKFAKDTFMKNKNHNAKTFLVEATRYQYLKKIIKENEKPNLKKRNKNGLIKLLVVCDYNFYYTKKQLEIINSVNSSFMRDYSVILKPHPAGIKSFHKYNHKNFLITKKPISNIINDVDLVFLSSTTAAAIEFYLLGKNIICLLDQETLNLSPLRGIESIKFISDADQFAELIKNPETLFNNASDTRKGIFEFDEQYSRWLSLIN